MTDTTTATTTTTDTNTNANTAPVLANIPEYAKLDPETRGYFQNRGLESKPLFDALLDTQKAHREAQKFVGVPANEIVRLPKPDAPEAEMRAFYQRLGAPAKAEEYDFKALKFADGTEFEKTELAGKLREKAYALGLPKDKAVDLAKTLIEHTDADEKAAAIELQAAQAKDLDELRGSWGARMEANKFIADQAAEKLGWGKDFFEKLMETKIVGRAQIANALLQVGQMMGEDRFVSSPNGPKGVMTREQAQAMLNEKMADREWGRKLTSGDATVKREWEGLTRLAAGLAA